MHVPEALVGFARAGQCKREVSGALGVIQNLETVSVDLPRTRVLSSQRHRIASK